MEAQAFITLMSRMKLASLLKEERGALTDVASRLIAAGAIASEEAPVYTRVSEVSAALERESADWRRAVAGLPAPRLVAAVQYVLTAAPASALEGSALLQELEAAFLAAGDDTALLESTLLAVQVLEKLFDPALPNLDEDRAAALNAALSGQNTAPAPAAPAPAPAEPAPQDSNVVQDLGGLAGREMGGVELYDYMKNAVMEEDSLFVRLTEKADTFAKYQKKKKRIGLGEAIGFLFEVRRYRSLTSSILPGINPAGADRAFAAAYLRFDRERGSRSRTVEEARERLVAALPDAEELYQLMEQGIGYQLNPANPKESEVLVLRERLREKALFKDLYPLVQRMEKLGKDVPEANLDAALFYASLIRQKKQDLNDRDVEYHYGDFDGEEPDRYLAFHLAHYFFTAHKRGGAAYAGCLYNIFYLYDEIFPAAVLSDVEKTMLSTADTLSEEKALAEYLLLMEKFGYTAGARKMKSRLYAKLLKRHKEVQDDGGKKRLVSTAVFGILTALVAILFPLLLNVPAGETPPYLTHALLGLAGGVLVLASQTVAMRFAFGNEKLLRSIPLIAMPVALAVHYLVRFGFTVPSTWWPGSAGTLFGASFAVPFMILVISAYLSRTSYTTLRRFLQAGFVYRPVVLVLFLAGGLITKILSSQTYLEYTTLHYNGFFSALFTCLIPAALSLIFTAVICFSAAGAQTFCHDAHLVSAVSLIFTAFGAIACGLTLAGTDLSATPDALDFPYRLINMQGALQVVLYFFLTTFFESAGAKAKVED
ncbi:MAG: hypothetical protein IJC84_02135 [Clostridia bacterium]|nr:hypothetical protein [Clostridia bacterium]